MRSKTKKPKTVPKKMVDISVTVEAPLAPEVFTELTQDLAYVLEALDNIDEVKIETGTTDSCEAGLHITAFGEVAEDDEDETDEEF